MGFIVPTALHYRIEMAMMDESLFYSLNLNTIDTKGEKTNRNCYVYCTIVQCEESL